MSVNAAQILREKYADAIRNGTRQKRGKKPRFSRDEAQRLRQLHREGWSYSRLAREFNASRSLVTKYVRDRFEPWRWSA